MTQGSLAGLKVVEYGEQVSGPMCARLLADMGAEVIKVEAPGRGDASRRLGPFPGDVPHPEKSGLFLYCNFNKQGVTLDVAHPTGRRILDDLLRTADIFIVSGQPHALAALGLTYDSLHAAHPRLIVTVITPFGLTGPYRDYKGGELVHFNMGGVAWETPTGGVDDKEEMPPLKAAGSPVGFTAAFDAAMATMLAVFERMFTDEGELVDCSEHEAMTALLRSRAPQRYWHHPPEGWAHELRETGIRRIFPTTDGWVSIGATNDKMWVGWVEAMGHPDWADTELFNSRIARQQNVDALWSLVAEWTTQHSKDEIFHLCQQHRCSCFAVYNIDEAMENPQVAARNLIIEAEHPVAGRLRFPGPLAHFSKTPWAYRCPAPLLGQHNDEVYHGELGYPLEHVVSLRAEGVI